MKRPIVIIGALLVLVLGLGGVSFSYFSRLSHSPLSKAPEHGVCFTLQADLPASESTNVIAELKEAVNRRLVRFGTRGFWEPVSPTQFRIYLPITDAETIDTASGLVSHQGRLEFRLVHENSAELLEQAQVLPGYREMVRRQSTSKNQPIERYLVRNKAEGGPSGIHIRSAMAAKAAPMENYGINFLLTPESARTFSIITKANVGRQLAILVDDELLLAPVIRDEIPSGAVQISGTFNRAEAVGLATALEMALPCAVKLVETKRF